MKNPLSDKFDLPEEKLLDMEEPFEIPEDKEERNLDLVIEMALKDYSSLREIVSMVEPANRLKYHQQMEAYLNLAKDAMAKKEKLEIDRVRASKAPSKSPQKATGDDSEKKEGQGTGEEGISRQELQERIRRVK